MAEELIDHVVYLIESKKGDPGRLNYILNTLQDGKLLYNSDKKYLDSLISTYMGTKKKFGEQKSVEELKSELARVKERLANVEKRGYKKPIGRKAIFFFITFVFGWHAVITLVDEKLLHDLQSINPYLFPLFQLDKIIPGEYLDYITHLGFNIPEIVIIVWGVMIFIWIILGFVYLVKFIRSRYNPSR
jgi:hypothetical protein